MDSASLPLADVVTAILSGEGETVLIGLGGATYDSSRENTEALLNSHDLRDLGVDVHDRAKVHGGDQCLIVNGTKIALQYGCTDATAVGPEGKIMSFNCRAPTDHELTSLDVVWLGQRIAENTAQLQQIRRRALPLVDPLKEYRRGNLGYPTQATMEKTLDATTQFYKAPVESEIREIPRQHRKKRLHALHGKRLKGRTATDTFYASVKSIRKFRAIQLFVHQASNFIYCKPLKKESQSHSAFQDFLRNVGIPNTLLSDNSQTQTGEKWAATCRQYRIKQTHSVPHNQNQNLAENVIGTLKGKVMMTLLYSCAPLVFWCYCLLFVVDCLNHTANSTLGGRTPTELLTGDTPDISVFRFKFWQPIWYIENPAKWPNSKKLPGRWVGIAWDYGDSFSYKIWTVPDGEWTKGCELVRNVVMPREETEQIPPSDQTPYESFKFKRKVYKERIKRGKKRKRRSSAALVDVGDNDLDPGAGVRPISSCEVTGEEEPTENAGNPLTNATGHILLPTQPQTQPTTFQKIPFSLRRCITYL